MKFKTSAMVRVMHVVLFLNFVMTKDRNEIFIKINKDAAVKALAYNSSINEPIVTDAFRASSLGLNQNQLLTNLLRLSL